MTLTRALQVFSLRKLQHSVQCTVDGLGPQRSSVMICLSWRVRYNWKSIRSDRVNGNPLSLNLALLTHKRTRGRKQAECFTEKKKKTRRRSHCIVLFGWSFFVCCCYCCFGGVIPLWRLNWCTSFVFRTQFGDQWVYVEIQVQDDNVIIFWSLNSHSRSKHEVN